MRLRTPALLALGALASFASALGVFATGDPGTTVPEPVAAVARPVDALPTITVARVVTLLEGPTPAQPPRLDRFSFIRADDVAMLVLPPADDAPPLRGTIDQEIASPWSTETRAEKAPPAEAPRVSGLDAAAFGAWITAPTAAVPPTDPGLCAGQAARTDRAGREQAGPRALQRGEDRLATQRSRPRHDQGRKDHRPVRTRRSGEVEARPSLQGARREWWRRPQAAPG